MLRSSRQPRPNRRGNILIVTLSLLALMAVVGITAVYYTKDQAERARIVGTPGPDIAFTDDGTNAMNVFLSSFIYDTNDYGADLLNSMRGHSLAATMYGRPSPTNPTPSIAWSGPGTVGGTSTFVADRRYLVNHRLFQGATQVADPEYVGERNATATAAGLTYSGTQYPKNPPYTYPDIKDFYLAAMCPATGEIITDAAGVPVISFHRNQVFGTLAPSNPNWTNNEGKYRTLRPRPIDHGNRFPPVPPNADGTYTGDVQNLPGSYGPNGVARNDSIWIDIGLPPITLANGRRVKPLVAPLILDLDGRLNLSVHGNTLGAGGIHSSGQGLGPWEVSLEKALAANVGEARAIVGARGTARTGSNILNKAYASRYPANNEMPAYAQVAWTGFSAANPLQVPTAPATQYFTSPSYSGGYSSLNNPTGAHPSLFNPNEWVGSTGPRAFTLADLKTLNARYASYPYAMSQLSAALSGAAPTTLRGTGAVPNPNPPGQSTTNNYRTDAAHTNRQLFTTRSFSLDRTGLMGIPGTATPDPNANLGPVDLNRQLTDYRTDTSLPLTPANTTAAQTALADSDRQQFAMDIFARLVAAAANPATEANLTLYPTNRVVTITATPGTAQYNRVRTLAQTAANIVDYIDNDDVNTRFAWNSTAPTEIVYGVEKPRLVINEAYGEVTNDPNDPAFTNNMQAAGMPAHVRFWIELQNPTTQAYTTANGGPMGDSGGNPTATGAARVKWTAAELGMSPAINPYQLLIVRNNKVAVTPVINGLRVTSDANYDTNVTGDLPGGVTPDVSFDFSTAGAAESAIPPANGVVDGGMVVLAANVPGTSPSGPEYNPAAFPRQINGAAIGNANALAYTTALPMTPDTDVLAQLGRHVILLRRLANPYLPGPNAANPYITVDVLDHVRAADRIVIANGQMNAAARTPRAMAGGMGYEPNAAGSEMLWPQSLGKVQPYTAYADPTVTTAAALAYPATAMVTQQNPGTPANGVKNTFNAQNSTLSTPYDWLVHMDRPLVNQLELLHITTGRQHDVTYNLVTAGGTKNTGLQGVILGGTYPTIYRAMDLLSVHPHSHQTALGGRVAGRININTIQDIRVWRALFDDNGFNGFPAGWVDGLWPALMAGTGSNTRTRTTVPRSDAAGGSHLVPVPGSTVYDTGTQTGDRPFLPFGGMTTPVTFGSALTNDTILRTPVNAMGMPTGLPYLTVLTGTHPYQQAEAARKILNNVTTVSHNFAVWVTVGYFEVESETPAATGGYHVTLGKEYYREAPGDTRKRFFAVVDRSNLAIDPATNTHPTVRPFFTTVEPIAPAVSVPVGSTTLGIATAGAGTVYSDGYAVTITAGQRLVVGVGANREIVTVTAVGGEAAGITTLTVSPTTQPHYAGECVSNVIPGNPGPQPSFDPNQDMYKPVVPVLTRLP